MQSGGRLKILGSTRRERDPLFPNIPSLHEGGVTGFDADGWAALWGPKGMSKELVALYSSVLNATLNSPETRAALHQNGVNPNPGTPEELLKTARITYDYWGRVIREAKIQPE
jgi:tripartite-type tricarboxylate transporter receptor subunit TctC